MRRLSLALVCLCLSIPARPAQAAYATGGQGYWSNGARERIDQACLQLPPLDEAICRVQAFKHKPFVVVALIDTGINPYHSEFRAPDFTVHPSEYISGYPQDATALDLSLDEGNYEPARAADETKFLLSGDLELHWVPGTRIVGAISFGAGGVASGRDERSNLDDQGHGTGSASVAAGQSLGANPNALIVMVEGLGDRSLKWVSQQPWIDVVSNSWGTLGNVPLGNATWTHQMAKDGKVIAFAAGNGFSNTGAPDRDITLTSPYAGPSWVVSVGAVDPADGRDTWWHGIPVDVSSFGRNWPSANAFSINGGGRFGGTSCATPITAGVLSAQILSAREAFGDTEEGPHAGGLASASPQTPLPALGPLADGLLTKGEVEDVVLKTANPSPDGGDFDGHYPTTPAYYLYEGYGVVDAASMARATEVLMGRAPAPDRSDVDTWIATGDQARDLVWGLRS